MQGQKPGKQDVKATVENVVVEPGRKDVRCNPHASSDGKHFEAKCPACGATSYLHDAEGKLYEFEEVKKLLEAREIVARKCLICGTVVRR